LTVSHSATITTVASGTTTGNQVSSSGLIANIKGHATSSTAIASSSGISTGQTNETGFTPSSTPRVLDKPIFAEAWVNTVTNQKNSVVQLTSRNRATSSENTTHVVVPTVSSNTNNYWPIGQSSLESSFCVGNLVVGGISMHTISSTTNNWHTTATLAELAGTGLLVIGI
jgi:hypothetical protein